MTEYDYSPEAYERFVATQNRIAKWVNDTEQHRPQFQPAVNVAQHPHRLHKEHSRRRKPSLYIHPPPPSDSSSSDSEDSIPPMPLSAPGMMYAAPAPPRYPGPPVAHAPQPLLSPPPMMPMVYPNTQRPPYYSYLPPTNHHHRSSHSHSIRSPHHSSAYYSMGPSPQVSPAYPHPQQFFYPPHSANPNAHPGYVIMPQHHPSKPPHQPVMYRPA
jgi:hypothetical protein